MLVSVVLWQLVQRLSMRSLFSIPRDVCYLNASYMTPNLKGAADACKQGVERRSMPWTIKPADFFTDIEVLRAEFADLLGAAPDNVALVPAASYGIATAAKNIKLSGQQKILLLEEQFPSNVYSWQRLANDSRAQIVTVNTPTDRDWTSAVLEVVREHGEAVAVASLPNHHWSNGAPLDLEKIAAELKANGTMLVLDVSQTLGAAPIDLQAIKPDYLVAAGYKWLFCPYGMSFLYVDEQHFGGAPIEESWANRLGSEDFSGLVDYEARYQHGARRFDVGERARPDHVAGAIEAIRQVSAWGIADTAQRLNGINNSIATLFEEYGFSAPDETRRAPHFQGLDIPDTITESLVHSFAERNVFLSQRGRSLRVAPHLYNDDEDMQRVADAAKACLRI